MAPLLLSISEQVRDVSVRRARKASSTQSFSGKPVWVGNMYRMYRMYLTRKGSSHQAGLSLIELLVVVVIIGVVAIVSLPNIAEIREIYRLRTAAQGLFVDLQRARAAAITERNRYHISLVDSASYQIHDDDNNNNAEDDGAGSIVVRPVYGEDVGSTISMNSAQVTFLPTGRVLDLVTTYFTVTSDGGLSRQVQVSTVGRILLSQTSQ